jgi:hypothetical protein
MLAAAFESAIDMTTRCNTDNTTEPRQPGFFMLAWYNWSFATHHGPFSMHQEPSQKSPSLESLREAARMLDEMCGAKGGEHLLPHCLLDQEVYPEQEEQTHQLIQGYRLSTRLVYRPGYD